MDRLINMASFAEIIDAGGLSAAADKLGCSRAVVSKRLSALERDFGVTLLNRTTRRQSLTEAGQTLYAHCRRMLDEMASAETQLHEFSASPRGTLRVSAPYSYGARVLSKTLPEFLKRYPDIRLELQLADQLADLAGASVDIAVRLTDNPAPGLVARKLVDVPYVVCASADYLRLHGTPTHPRELAWHNCLYYVGGIIQTPWHFDGPDGHSVVEVRGSLTVNSVDVLRDAVVGGLGIAAMSRYHLTEEIADGRVVELLVEYRLPERAIYLVTLPDRLLPAKTRALIDFLLQRGDPAQR